MRALLYKILQVLQNVLNVDVLSTEDTATDEIIPSDVSGGSVDILTPSSGKKIDTRSVFLGTNSTSGEVWIHFKNSTKPLGKIYCSKFAMIALDSVRKKGGVDEPVTVSWSNLDNNSKIFCLVRYKEVEE